MVTKWLEQKKSSENGWKLLCRGKQVNDRDIIITPKIDTDHIYAMRMLIMAFPNGALARCSHLTSD